MRAALLQYDPVYLEVHENLGTVHTWLAEVDADLIVLPELFATGYFFRSDADRLSVCESIPDGETTQALLAWASATGATFVAGLPEIDADGSCFNSAVVVSPDGVQAIYRKNHLFYQEKHHFLPGNLGFPVVEVRTRDGVPYNLGVMICFDWYFPESARTLALAGADVIAHPSNLVRKSCPSAMPVRALENHVYTITANRIGEETDGEEELTFIGQSLICDPGGEVVARFGRLDEGWLVAEFDPHAARNRQITTTNDLFKDRRPELYAV